MSIIDPLDLQINRYNYNLPDDRIAKYPLASRDQSKLLVYKNKMIYDEKFESIAHHLPSDSLIIFNNTRVIQARLFFKKLTGALIEIFCLDPYSPNDYTQSLQATKKCSWKCLIGNLKKWKDAVLQTTIITQHDSFVLRATKVKSSNNSHIVEFDWDNSNYTFADILQLIGELPIPPYLNRDTDQQDIIRYQTLYSKINGSVAAPTAGLHFTKEIIDQIQQKGIITEQVTLHVGAGTFKPVKCASVKDHQMHSEFIEVKKDTILKLMEHTGNVIAVGTTSVRTLESIYQIGLYLENNSNPSKLDVDQWQAYKTTNTISKQSALQNIVDYLDRNSLDSVVANTQIILVPGYDFKIVTGMVTNFHQPQSTLLLLVSAFVDKNWKAIYNHALSNQYRFLSYGDTSLLLR